ncbi:MAG: AI-2E family transporter [Candidatus Dojkabacteria bacterium]|nr:MAG: AI-2E family transporter [Candidatus Dojkabacteria bacterium]
MKKNQIFFYLFFVLITIATFFLVKPYLVTVILAFFSALLFYPIYEVILKRTKNRSALSAILTLFVVLIIMLIPMTLLIGLTLRQVAEFKDNILSIVGGTSVNIDQVIMAVNNLLDKIPGVEEELTTEEVVVFVQQSLKSLTTWLLGSALLVGNNALELITKFILYVTLLLTFLVNRDKIVDFIMHISPMDNKVDRLYIKRVSEMSKSMILGTLAISAAQAASTALVMYLLGIPYSVFWGALMTFTGIIPFVGTQIVSVPVAIFEIASGNIWEGVLLILFAIFVVGFIDNFLRPMLVTKEAELHPMLTLLGVLGGMKLFGVLGFILGPVLMIIFYTTVETYLKYYKKA